MSSILFSQAQTAIEEGDWDGAIARLESLRKEQPGHPQVYQTLAQAQAVRGRFRSVLATHRERLELLMEENRLPEAEQTIAQLLGLQPESLEARRYRIDIENARGQTGRAIDLTRELARLCLEKGDEERSLGLLRQAHERHPENLDIALELAETLVAFGHISAGSQLFQQTAEAFQALENLPRAVDVYRRLKVVTSDEPSVMLTLGALYRQLGQLENAESELRAVLRLDLNHQEALLGLGAVCQLQERHRSGILAFKKALQNNPDLPEAHHRLGELYGAQGMQDDAADHFLSAAKMYLGMDRTPDAIMGLRQLLEATPGHREGQSLLLTLGAAPEPIAAAPVVRPQQQEPPEPAQTKPKVQHKDRLRPRPPQTSKPRFEDQRFDAETEPTHRRGLRGKIRPQTGTEKPQLPVRPCLLSPEVTLPGSQDEKVVKTEIDDGLCLSSWKTNDDHGSATALDVELPEMGSLFRNELSLELLFPESQGDELFLWSASINEPEDENHSADQLFPEEPVAEAEDSASDDVFEAVDTASSSSTPILSTTDQSEKEMPADNSPLEGPAHDASTPGDESAADPPVVAEVLEFISSDGAKSPCPAPEPVGAYAATAPQTADAGRRMLELGKAIDSESQNRAWRLALADLQLRYGHLEEAVRQYRLLLANTPEESELWHRLIQAELWCESYSEAQNSLLALAALHRRRGEHNEAVDVLYLALSLEPQHLAAQRALAEISLVHPQSVPVEHHLKRLIESAALAGDFDQAVWALGHLRDRCRDSDPFLPLKNLARKYLDAEEHSVCLTLYSVMTVSAPERADLRRQLLDLHRILAAGPVSEHIRALVESLLLENPHLPERWFEAGEVRFHQGELDGAMECFQKSRRDPAWERASHAMLGLCLEAKGGAMRQLAAKQIEKALQLPGQTPDDAELGAHLRRMIDP